MKSNKTIALALAITLTIPISSSANLGDSLSKANSREGTYGKQYGAVDPLFKSDGNGNVIWECWAAPPSQWSESEAISFARELLPKAIKNEMPKKGAKDGSYYSYTLSDGTMIVISGYGGRIDGVAVRSSGYSGSNC